MNPRLCTRKCACGRPCVKYWGHWWRPGYGASKHLCDGCARVIAESIGPGECGPTGVTRSFGQRKRR